MGTVVEDVEKKFGKTGKGEATRFLLEDPKIKYALIAFGLIIATAVVASQFVR